MDRFSWTSSSNVFVLPGESGVHQQSGIRIYDGDKKVEHLAHFCIIPQGSYRSWKTWKVMEFNDFIFQAWKVMEFWCGSCKVMENDVNFTKFII